MVDRNVFVVAAHPPTSWQQQRSAYFLAAAAINFRMSWALRDLDFEDRPPRAPRLRDLDLGLREVLRDLRLRQRPVTLLRYWLLLHRLRGALRDLDFEDLDLDLYLRQRPVIMLR